MALTPQEEALVRQLIQQNPELLSLAAVQPQIITELGAQDATLSDLPVASGIAATDILLMRSGTNDKSITYSNLVPASATPAANKIPLAGANNLINDGWLNISATPAANKVPRANSSGLLADGWLNISVTPAANKVPKTSADGKLNAWVDIPSKYDICEFYYFRNPTLKAGMQPAQGGLITNAATRYPEAWAYLQTAEGKLLCKTEAEWQAMTRATWATLADGTKVGWDGIGGAPFYVQNLAAGTLRMPDLRGMYPEAAGFDSLGVGDAQGDKMRQVSGSMGFGGESGSPSPSTGPFYLDGYYKRYTVSTGNTHDWMQPFFDISRVVPTGAATAPRRWGALACCYLGRPV